MNMKKRIIGITFLIILMGILPSAANASVNIGMYGGFKFAGDALYIDLYGSSSPSFGLCGGINLFWRLQLVGEYNFSSDKGKMSVSEEEITFSNQSWSVGLRIWIATIMKNKPYVGGGVTEFSFEEDLPDRFDDFRDKKVGFYLELGDYYPLIGSKVYLDLNIKYVKVDVQPYDDKISLGGLKTTLGVRFYF
jgi:hypothetical protein